MRKYLDIMNSEKKTTLLQFIKYGIVGVSNTLITAIVIWVLLKLFNTSDVTANSVGYIAGLLNSFIWNRRWTFQVKTKIKETFLKFVGMFLVCYLLQLGVVFLLLNYTAIDQYVCHIIGMVIYTLINFTLNKFYTFKKTDE